MPLSTFAQHIFPKLQIHRSYDLPSCSLKQMREHYFQSFLLFSKKIILQWNNAVILDILTMLFLFPVLCGYYNSYSIRSVILLSDSVVTGMGAEKYKLLHTRTPPPPRCPTCLFEDLWNCTTSTDYLLYLWGHFRLSIPVKYIYIYFFFNSMNSILIT